MEITVKDLSLLEKDSYQLIDIRSEVEIAHGMIPGAISVSAEKIEESQEIDSSKKLVICCTRGQFSKEAAQRLTQKGFDAVSLSGGYTAWLLNQMQEEKESDISKDVEQSLRKKFRKNIWCRFTKAINQYELVKEGDYNGLHFIQCACIFTDTCTTCSNEENRSKRVEIKELIKEMKKTNPFVEGNIFKSVENVNLDTVIAYKTEGVRYNFLDQYDSV